MRATRAPIATNANLTAAQEPIPQMRLRYSMIPAIVALAGAIALPQPVAAQTAKDSVIATVNEFFRAMTAKDTAAARRSERIDGVSFAVRIRPESTTISRNTTERYLQQLANMRDTYVERMWEPTVLIHGPIAVVWAPYDIHRNGQFVHCGVDAFTLIRSSTGWQIATTTYTAEPIGCKPSPLGPPKPE